jgi:hypothetical protein
LVDANVGIVLSLARELLVHRSLNADQIAEIVEKAKLALIEARVPGTSPFDPIQTVQLFGDHLLCNFLGSPTYLFALDETLTCFLKLLNC